MTFDTEEMAIDAAERAIDSYVDQVGDDEVIDSRDLAENVVRAIDAALAGALLRAFNADEIAKTLRKAIADRQP